MITIIYNIWIVSTSIAAKVSKTGTEASFTLIKNKTLVEQALGCLDCFTAIGASDLFTSITATYILIPLDNKITRHAILENINPLYMMMDDDRNSKEIRRLAAVVVRNLASCKFFLQVEGHNLNALSVELRYVKTIRKYDQYNRRHEWRTDISATY
jgi:hypothetical protein